MTFPLLPVALIAAGVGAFALFGKGSVITQLPANAVVPPPPPRPQAPPAAPGQLPPIPQGMALLPDNTLSPLITSADGTVFAAQSSPESIGPPSAITDQLRPGDCITIDVGVARLNVKGITSGNMAMKVTGMPKANGIQAQPIDPRLPAGLPAMDIPFAAISGAGDCT